MFTAVFSGRIGDNLSFKYTAKAEPMVLCSIAVRTGADSEPLWVDVSMFGKAAETFAKLEPHQGDFVLVRVVRVPMVGVYEGKKGVKGSLKVNADWIEICHRAIGTGVEK